MKKAKIACVLSLCMLCSCSFKNNDTVDTNIESVSNVYDANVIKSETEESISMSSSISKINATETVENLNEYSQITEISADSDITLEKLALMRLDEMVNSLIQKDAGTWQQYIYSYVDGDDGYLYNVDFEDYKIIDFSVTEKHKLYRCSAAFFNVEISVSKSHDIRFPQGCSRWKIMLYGNNLNCCMYFLRDIYPDTEIYLETSENEAAQLGFVFSYSFNCFETVNNISEYCLTKDDQALRKGLRAFVYLMPNAAGVSTQLDEWNSPIFTVQDVDVTISRYLGINNHTWSERIIGLGGDLWKTWDMKTVYAIITEKNESYVDMVYFADYVYLTPAKKMRYYFTYNDDTIQLLGTELIEDYGYEPNWELN